MAQKMTCDADCARSGWVEYFVTGPRCEDMHVSVPRDADLGQMVEAFDHDLQCMVGLNGWLLDWELIED